MLPPIQDSLAELRRYHGEAPSSYWQVANVGEVDLISLIRNGVGSPSSWTYRFTPQDCWPWGCGIVFSADQHDWGYTFPLIFKTVADGLAWKNYCDAMFRDNIIRKAQALGGIWQNFRIKRAHELFEILQVAGAKAFWSNRDHLPDDFYAYYRNELDPPIDTKALSISQTVEDSIRIIYPGYQSAGMATY